MPEEKAMTAAVGLEADRHNDTEQDIAALANEVSEQDIAALAYELWQARGCPYGSPEEDWFRAVQQLRRDQNDTALREFQVASGM